MPDLLMPRFVERMSVIGFFLRSCLGMQVASRGEEPQPDRTIYSFLATSGPVMRRSSGMVEAIMQRLTAMPAPVMT